MSLSFIHSFQSFHPCSENVPHIHNGLLHIGLVKTIIRYLTCVKIITQNFGMPPPSRAPKIPSGTELLISVSTEIRQVHQNTKCTAPPSQALSLSLFYIK